MDNPEKLATLVTQYTGRRQTAKKTQKQNTDKTKTISNTNPINLLKWTESGAKAQKVTDESVVWQNYMQKMLASKHTFETLSLVLYCTFVFFHAQISAVSKLYVLAMDAS
jgi:hypothetical protein